MASLFTHDCTSGVELATRYPLQTLYSRYRDKRCECDNE